MDVASIFFSVMIGRLSDVMMYLAARTSKTKAMNDPAWHSLKPRSFKKLKSNLKSKKSIPVLDPVVRHNKKRKISSSQGWSNFYPCPSCSH